MGDWPGSRGWDHDPVFSIVSLVHGMNIMLEGGDGSLMRTVLDTGGDVVWTGVCLCCG